MAPPPESKPNFITKYLNKMELFGWLLCASSMLTIVFAKELNPQILPFAWIGAIFGAGIIGWGAGQKHKRK
ncbi:hypothetical protein [Aliiglaciecola sp. NS0011-25]|uniref:hypothetical protein n=1 Tax=Aliiglaciecola sp. NS0011-25 TaxID=3127654 RepID=UPI003104070E